MMRHSSDCTAHLAERSKPHPVRSLKGLRARNAGTPSAERTSGQQTVPQALQPELASPARIAARRSLHITAPCARKPSAKSGKQDCRRALAAGRIGGGQYSGSGACRTRGGKAGRSVPSDGLPIARRTRAQGRRPLPRPLEASEWLRSTSNELTEHQLQRLALSGKPFTAAPQRMQSVLQRLGTFVLTSLSHKQECTMPSSTLCHCRYACQTIAVDCLHSDHSCAVPALAPQGQNCVDLSWVVAQ